MRFHVKWVKQPRLVAEDAAVTADEVGKVAKDATVPHRLISWLISVIVDARSQLEYAKRDKSEGNDDEVLK